MKKLFIMFLGIAATALCGNAATALKLTLANGQTPAFVLSEKPAVTFPGANMVITSSDASATYARADVVKMEFTETSTGIKEDFCDPSQTISYLDNTVTAPGQAISVYDLNGAIALQGNNSLQIDQLAAGVYVVKTQIHSIKIIKK